VTLTASGPSAAAAARPIEHDDVRGSEARMAEVRASAGGPAAWQPVPWEDLGRRVLDPGSYRVRFHFDGGDALRVPVCAGRQRVVVDGRDVAAPAGPVVVPWSAATRGAANGHDVVIDVSVSPYERRIACGEAPRAGAVVRTAEGLGALVFDSPYASRGGGRAVVFVPRGHDVRRPAALLVGAHPWNGSTWTYAAVAELLASAQERDVVLLFPSGLGNSLYAADAEDEVLRAMDAAASVVAVDPRAVSIWGASMGGAGATTISFHHPDRFASVTSLFGDSKYDLATYVRPILRDEAGAHLVNALDVVENARNLPVWLVHGEDDRTSPIAQSEMLASALHQRGFRVRFDRIPRAGHDGALVARFAPDIVDLAATARAATSPARVSYRSVRPADTEAYGARIERAGAAGDAFVDIERRDDAVHVLRVEHVTRVLLARGALGTDPAQEPAIVVDAAGADSIGVSAAWAP
jgi:pimeloyl-ACP methyl ester carboxylesterase